MNAQQWKRLSRLEANAPDPASDLLPWSDFVDGLLCMCAVDGAGRLIPPYLDPDTPEWEPARHNARAWVKRLEAWRAAHGGAAIYPVTSHQAAIGLELLAAGAMHPDPWAPVLALLRACVTPERYAVPGESHIPQLWPGEEAEPYTRLACAMATYDRMRCATWPDRTPVDVDDLRRWLADAYTYALAMERFR